jgi:hypothetical protein
MILPEGFVLEQSTNLPEGFVLEKKTTPNVEINPYEMTMREMTQYVPKNKTGLSPILAGLGGETIKNIGAITELASPKYGKPITQFGQAMTNVANEANPIMGTVGQIGSYFAPVNVLSKGANLINASKTLPAIMAKSAGVGGTLGFLTTPDSMLERGKSALLNASIGGAVPAVGALANKVYQGGKSMLEPFYEKGQEAIIARALRNFAGGQSNEAITNLMASKPTVKGSLPTVGQASGVPSLAATERALQNASPEATNMLANRQTQNALARTNALENIASPTRIDKYTDLRAKLGEDLYEPAIQKSMDFAKLTPELQQQIQVLIKAPAIKKAMSQAKTNALNEGIDIGNPSGSLRGLHQTKIALDKQIAVVKAKLEKDGIATATDQELNGLKAAKDRLLVFIENPQISPDYKIARETYARLSKPVDQLEQIAKLADRSVSAKDNTIYTDRFFKELEKVKKDGLLSKQQIARLKAIGDDLQLKSFAENAGRGVGSNTVQNLAYGNTANSVGLPNMLRTTPSGQIVERVAKKIGNTLYGQANKDITNKMAETMLSPQRAAELMQMPTQQSQNLANIQKAQNLAKMLMLQQSTQGTQP